MKYVTIFSAFLTPVITIVTIYIVCQQYRLNKLNTREKLYDRRMRIFGIVKNFIADVLQNEKSIWDFNKNFYRETTEVEFLFQPNIKKYIDELYCRSNKFALIISEIESEKDEEKKKALINKRSQIRAWFGKQFSEASLLFKEELNLIIGME